MRATVVSTAATVYPVALDDAKQHLGITWDDHDSLIRLAIASATSVVESYTHRALVTRTSETRFDGFAPSLWLPDPPLQSVTSVSYIDSNGDLTVVDTSVYTVDTYSQPGRVHEAYGQTWPTPRDEPHSVRIVHVHGYGTTPESIPPALYRGLLLLVGEFFEHRESIVAGVSVTELPNWAERLLLPWVVHTEGAW